MARTAARLAAIAAAALGLGASAAPVAAGGPAAPPSISQRGARELLAAKLAESTDGSRHTSLTLLEDDLRTTYQALPKNARGNLGHQAVRYILHRHFVHNHGWYVLGLEPTVEHADREWVPSFLQDVLETGEDGQGTTLRELAALTATLKDIIDRESSQNLETSFLLHGASKDQPQTQETLYSAVRSVFMNFLWNNRVKALDPDSLKALETNFVRDYKAWDVAEQWLNATLKPRLDDIGRQGRNATFADAERMVRDIGESYYQLNDRECNDLRSQMVSIEGRKPGRVRLSQFYQKALYSHWEFTESEGYLTTLGALDVSDPTTPHVIVPNYVMARTNCLEATQLYSICCRSECEDLMGNLEAKLGGSSAPSAGVANLVSNLKSATVSAPRELSPALLKRLDEVAAAHDGKVPLHGRLFAQWMHHAFPRECPYPHAAGTTSPLTPDEWMQANNGRSTTLSRDEMQRTVDADTCSSKFPGVAPSASDCGGDAELPWSHHEDRDEMLQPQQLLAGEEEVVVVRRLFEPTDAPSMFGSFTAGLVRVAAFGGMVVFIWLGTQGPPAGGDKMCNLDGGGRLSVVQRARLAGALVCAMVLAYSFGLLNFGALAASATASAAAIYSSSGGTAAGHGGPKGLAGRDNRNDDEQLWRSQV